MDSLENYRILVSVVDCGGFSAAAKALKLTTAKVSRAVADLEAESGVQLLSRSTRRVAVTETGEAFLSQLRPALKQLESATEALARGEKAPVFNSLRLACCRAGGLGLVAGAATSFLASHGQFHLTLDLHDRAVDAEREGYDLVLAITSPDEDTATGRRSLLPIDLAVVAAPTYIALHKRPQSPTELLQHRLLVWDGMPCWQMRDGKEITPGLFYSSNDLSVIKSYCSAANGIALLPGFMIAQALRERSLVQLLDGFEPKPLQLRASWGSRSQPNAAGVAFLRHLTQHLRSHPA